MRMPASTLLVLAFLSAAVLWMGCGGAAREPVGKPAETTKLGIPDWFLDTPRDTVYLYSTGTALSRDKRMAINMAKNNARVDIARQVDLKIELFTKGTDIVASRETTSAILSGCETLKTEVTEESPGYRAYILMGVPIEKARANLKAR